jgi:hypothetical protein
MYEGLVGLARQSTTIMTGSPIPDGYLRPVPRQSFFVLLPAMLLLYWPVLTKRYVYDDWLVLRSVWADGWGAYLAGVWNPAGALHYRPLAQTLFAVIYGLFGISSFPTHLAALALHLFNTLLIVSLCKKLGASQAASFLSGFLFLSLVSIHIDPLLWLVGLYDILLLSFSLLAVVSFLDDRPVVSTLCVVLALLTKEAAVFLLPLLIAWNFFRNPSWKYITSLSLLFAVYFFVKSVGLSPFSLDAGNAHAMSLSILNALALLRVYLDWLGASLIPPITFFVPEALGLAFIVVTVLLWETARKHLSSNVPVRQVVLLAVWGFLALLPVLFLENQSARYYALHAAVPMSILIGIVVTETIDGLTPRSLNPIVVIALAAILAGNALFAIKNFSLGYNQRIQNDGWFHLVKRSAGVDSLYTHLFLKYPSLPRGSCIHITGIPLDAIGGDAAVQLWYRDSSLTVDVGSDSSRTLDVIPSEMVRVKIDAPE